jgi:hypothetical protein
VHQVIPVVVVLPCRGELKLLLKRLDPSHLHSQLEVPGLTYPGRDSNPGLHVGGEHSR